VQRAAWEVPRWTRAVGDQSGPSPTLSAWNRFLGEFIDQLAIGILPNGKVETRGWRMLLLAGFEPDAFGFLVWRGHELADCLKQ